MKALVCKDGRVPLAECPSEARTWATLLTLTLLFGCSAAGTGGATGGGGASAASANSTTAGSSTGGSSTGSSSSGCSSSGSGGAGGADMLDGPIERGGLLVLEFHSLYFD